MADAYIARIILTEVGDGDRYGARGRGGLKILQLRVLHYGKLAVTFRYKISQETRRYHTGLASLSEVGMVTCTKVISVDSIHTRVKPSHHFGAELLRTGLMSNSTPSCSRIRINLYH